MCILILIFISCAVSSVSPYRSNELYVTNGGDYGSWSYYSQCPEGAYGIGYSMKLEPRQGGGDDTALNAVKIICAYRNGGGYAGRLEPEASIWGDWTSEVRCIAPGGNQYYLKAFALQVEGPQGESDDTEANFIKFRCAPFDGDVWSDGYTLAVYPGYGLWGDYGSWSSSCGRNSAVCGIQVKAEAPQGPDGDDTALNDVRLICCSD